VSETEPRPGSEREAGETAGDFEAAYFADNYRDYAAQNPPAKLRFYERTIARFAPARRPLELLDVGCGLGRFLAHMAAAGGYQLHGTDLSRFAVAENARHFPEIDFRCAAATDRPFPDASLDVITAFDVIEHVPPLAAVGEAVAAMLRPGGLFVFVVPVYDGLSGPLIRHLDHDPTHVHKREREFWLRFAGERFTVLGWWGMLRYLLPGRFYLHLPTRLFRRHTPAILVAAQKPLAGADPPR
jgi:SAM-dependent methyltransferase